MTKEDQIEEITLLCLTKTEDRYCDEIKAAQTIHGWGTAGMDRARADRKEYCNRNVLEHIELFKFEDLPLLINAPSILVSLIAKERLVRGI